MISFELRHNVERVYRINFTGIAQQMYELTLDYGTILKYIPRYDFIDLCSEFKGTWNIVDTSKTNFTLPNIHTLKKICKISNIQGDIKKSRRIRITKN